MIFFNKIGCYC